MFFKTARPINTLCRAALTCAQDGNLAEARCLIDQVRGLSHLLDTTLAELKSKEFISSLSDDDISALAPIIAFLPETQASLDTVFEWIKSSYDLFGMDELVQSREGLDLLIDFALPTRWNFATDIVFLCGEHMQQIYKCLIARGQRRFVIYWDNSEEQGYFSKWLSQESESVLIIKDDVMPNIPKLRAVFGDARCDLSVISTCPTRYARVSADFTQLLRSHAVTANTASWLPRQTTVQFLSNLHHLCSSNSVMVLASEIRNKDVLVVSPGPSLVDDLPKLKTCREDFLIIAALKAVDVLLEYDIHPDFAIWQDPRDHAFALPVKSEAKHIPLILSDSCHSLFFEAGFTDYFTFPDPQFIGTEISKLLHGRDLPMLSGGSVSTLASMIALEFGCSSLTLLGQDLSISRGLYAGLSPNPGGESQAGQGSLKCAAIGGEFVETLPNYMSFIFEFQELATKFHATPRYNSTSAGAFLEGWTHCSLEQAAATVVKDSSPRKVTKSQRFPARQTTKSGLLSCLSELIADMKRLEEKNRELSEMLSNYDTEKYVSPEADVLELKVRDLLRKPDSIFLTTFATKYTLDMVNAASVIDSEATSLALKVDYFSSLRRSSRQLIAVIEAQIEAFSE